jgi:hypothetical protein
VSHTIPSPSLLPVPSLPLPFPPPPSVASSSSSSSPSSPSSSSSILSSALSIHTNPLYNDIINTARIHFNHFGWAILPSSIFSHHQKFSEKVVRLPAFSAPKQAKGKIAGEVTQVNLEKIKEFTNEMRMEWYAIIRSVAFIVGIGSVEEIENLSIVSDKLLCAPPTKGEQALHFDRDDDEARLKQVYPFYSIVHQVLTLLHYLRLVSPSLFCHNLMRVIPF